MSTESDLSKRASTLLISALVAAVTTSALETSMVFTAVKALLEEYGRPTAVAWLLSGYLLVAAATAAIGGRLGDLFGRRRVLLLMMGGAVIGSLISALSPTLEGVIIGRSIQGLAGATLPLALGLAREHIAPRKLNMSVAIITSSAALGSGVGMILGGVLVDTGGWRHLFVASAAIAAAFVAYGLWAIPKSRSAPTVQKLDLLGGVLFVPGVAGALLAISSGRGWNWDPRFWGLLAASLIVLAVWIRHELRHPDPLIDVRLLKDPRIALTNATFAVAAIGVLQFSQLMLLLLQQPVWTGVGLGLTATMAAALKAPGNFITTFASPLWGHLGDRFGPQRIIVGGMAVVGAGCLMLMFTHNSLWATVAIALVGSLGVASSFAAVPMILARAAPIGRTSETIGLADVLRSAGQAVGSQLMLMILATTTISDPARGAAEFPTAHAYQLMFGTMAGACVLTMLLALTIPHTRKPTAPSATADEGAVAAGRSDLAA